MPQLMHTDENGHIKGASEHKPRHFKYKGFQYKTLNYSFKGIIVWCTDR